MVRIVSNLTEQEKFDLDANYSDEGGSLLHEQGGNTYILSLDSHGIPLEAWEWPTRMATAQRFTTLPT